MPDFVIQARNFLAGESLTFQQTDSLWKELRKLDKLPLARAVLSRLRQGKYLSDALPADKATLDELCRQEALLTSKDPELSASTRHRLALDLMGERFVLDRKSTRLNSSHLGIS